MIRRVRLQNYKSHGSTEIRLAPLSLLVGPAGSGKSNLLKALIFVQNTMHKPIVELFPPATPWEFRLVRSRWAGQTDPIGFEIELDGVEGSEAIYVLRFSDSPDGIYVLEETLQRRRPPDEWQWVFQRRWPGNAELGEFGVVKPRDPSVLYRVWYGSQPDDPRDGPRFARAVAKALWKTGYYHLEVSRLKQLGDDRDTDRIGYNGQDLPGFLAGVQHRDPPSFERILTAMRELLPSLDRIVITRPGPDQQGLAMTFHEQQGYINAPDLSDGTLLTLGLLAITQGRKQPHLLCVEEPETGLHPRRIRWLFDRFVEIAHPREGAPVQVVLTTHSPYLVDLFKDMQDSVSVVEHQKGRTSVRNLVDIKKKLRDDSSGDPIGHEWATGLFEGL